MENHGIVMFLEQSLDDMKQYMQSTITAYLQLRGRGNSFLPFWDCVVITACDADQALAFRLQLDHKEKAKLVPATKFIVVEDVPPFPGCKIGAGGSTFLVIERLRKLYGTDLERQKILLIHAGGWSQRLPSASILGKLFMPLPIGNFDMDMLDLKLALYMPFIPFMKPGIFLTASDDIELFNLTLPTPSSPHSGFVCLGHPSSLHIGSTHGVYVCDKSSTVGLSSFLGCHRVLQKPTEQEMWNAGAVLRGQSGGADGIPFVISDSAYWFDMEIVGKLERFYQKHGIPEVEVDAYGDFLQPLGDAATQDYIDKGKNAKLSDTRRDLFSCLRDAPVQVLFLPQSLFLHLGTMPEYLHNVLSDKMFRECFDIRNTCMKSSISSDCDISPKAVLEYCNFSAPVKVNDNCFLSGCCAKIGDPVEIPEGTFMHTVVISKDGRRCYATIFCGIGDDIKREVDAKNVVDLMLFNKPLSSYGAFRSMRHEPKLSLWTLKLFKICSTPDLSFYKSLEQINSLRNGMEVGLERDESMISMSDVLALKDVQGMLELRSFLNHTGISGTGIDIVSTGIEAVKPESLIKASVSVKDGLLTLRDFNGAVKMTYPVASRKDVYIFAVGKAALGMFKAVYAHLENFVAGGFVMLPCEQGEMTELNRLKYRLLNVIFSFGGRNNLPDTSSVESTQEAIKFLRTLPSGSCLICCISGGASAILVAPKLPVTLEDKLTIIKQLAQHGAPINELNTVRGCLSDVKFGHLLHHIPIGVQVGSLVLSDIIGDPIELIGGAPTVSRRIESADAVGIMKKYGLWDGIPKNVEMVLLDEHAQAVPAVAPANILIGNNMVALRACRDTAKALGYQPVILSDCLQGFAKDVGADFVRILRTVAALRNGERSDAADQPRLLANVELPNIDWRQPVCFLAGGETTVRVHGTGKGGRNQEMVLAFAIRYSEERKACSGVQGMFVSVGTDGQDGPTDAAGAVVCFPLTPDPRDVERANTALTNNDAYNFFCDANRWGQLVKTGPTGTNVMDLQLLLID